MCNMSAEEICQTKFMNYRITKFQLAKKPNIHHKASRKDRKTE